MLKAARIAIVGDCGAGKTTLARELGMELSLPCINLDALRHGPAWGYSPDFEEAARAALAGSCWITDSSAYEVLYPQMIGQADVVVWLDRSRFVLLWRIVRRTIDRHHSPRARDRSFLHRRHPLWVVSLHHRRRRRRLAGALELFALGPLVRVTHSASATEIASLIEAAVRGHVGE